LLGYNFNVPEKFLKEWSLCISLYIFSAQLEKTMINQDLPSHEKSKSSMLLEVQIAFKQVTLKVIEKARQTNTPIIIWDNGKAISLSADEAEKFQQ
jgi:hypothetical protein